MDEAEAAARAAGVGGLGTCLRAEDKMLGSCESGDAKETTWTLTTDQQIMSSSQQCLTAVLAGNEGCPHLAASGGEGSGEDGGCVLLRRCSMDRYAADGEWRRQQWAWVDLLPRMGGEFPRRVGKGEEANALAWEEIDLEERGGEERRQGTAPSRPRSRLLRPLSSQYCVAASPTLAGEPSPGGPLPAGPLAGGPLAGGPLPGGLSLRLQRCDAAEAIEWQSDCDQRANPRADPKADLSTEMAQIANPQTEVCLELAGVEWRRVLVVLVVLAV